MNQFLIPANTKKGQLIANLFYPIDLAILLSGVFVTFILLLILSETDTGTVYKVLALIPGLVCVGLVVPIPNYHNVRIALGEIINFYSNVRNYKWRGWCVVYESSRKENK